MEILNYYSGDKYVVNDGLCIKHFATMPLDRKVELFDTHKLNVVPLAPRQELLPLISGNFRYMQYEFYDDGYTVDELLMIDNDLIKLDMVDCNLCVDRLIFDKSSVVKRSIARYGLYLDVLINDLDYHVRIEIARRGYEVDRLLNDSNPMVFEAAVNYIRRLEREGELCGDI